ncbi:MAG: HDOD domain-containing protein [Fuerstiella sp.]
MNSTPEKKIRLTNSQRLARLSEIDWNHKFDLPVPPQAVIEFSKLSRVTDIRIQHLSNVVEQESGLTTELLKSVNSSVYSFRRTVESVPQAIALLGATNCTSLFLTRVMDQTINDVESPLISNMESRRQALERARFSRVVAQRLGMNPLLSYTASNIQDILLPLLTAEYHDEYRNYLSSTEYYDLEQFERETFGWTHSELTAHTLMKWGFPDSLVMKVLKHHDPPEELFLQEGQLDEATPNSIASLLGDVLNQAPCGITRLVDLQRFHPRMSVLEMAEEVDLQNRQQDETSSPGMTLVSRIQASMIEQIQRRRREAIVPGRQFGNYVLEDKLAESSMGAVFKAKHIMLRRAAAIKFLRVDRISAESIQQFETEVQVTSTLSHPSTISIFDYGKTSDDLFYYAMEYVDGWTLQQFVEADGPVPDGRVQRILLQICGSLSEAHAYGLIHRDIKPQNIVLSEGIGGEDRVTVLDFGLVSQATSSNVEKCGIKGTPLYMSPECAAGQQQLDGRSDLYSVAALGYFLLTGKTVFDGNVIELLEHHIHTQPTLASRRTTNRISSDLEKLLLRTLSKDPEERPQSALDMIHELTLCKDLTHWSSEQSKNWWMAGARDRIEQHVSPELDAGDATVIGDVSGSATSIGKIEDSSDPNFQLTHGGSSKDARPASSTSDSALPNATLADGSLQDGQPQDRKPSDHCVMQYQRTQDEISDGAITAH